jgi:hypothetical protein
MDAARRVAQLCAGFQYVSVSAFQIFLFNHGFPSAREMACPISWAAFSPLPLPGRRRSIAG